MSTRAYNQFCTLAFALDLVGDRWTLLIIRELLTGPRRFTDLTHGLPGISSNLLSERLKGLEQHGVLQRRVLPPPAGSPVYELTPLGRSLESALVELGKWGNQFLPATLEGIALPSPGAIALTLKSLFQPERERGIAETYELHLDNEILQVQVREGELSIQQGQAPTPQAVFHTSIQVFAGLFAGQIEPEAAISSRLIQVEGDPDALSRLLRISGVPAGSLNQDE